MHSCEPDLCLLQDQLLTDHMRNVGDVIARNREIDSSKSSILATCLYTAS